jgi:COP9 signalosome complex subunit 3
VIYTHRYLPHPPFSPSPYLQSTSALTFCPLRSALTISRIDAHCSSEILFRGGGVGVPMVNMAAISALVSASAKLHDITGSSYEAYDRQIRDHVAYCRNLLSTKALSSVSRDGSVLDVSSFLLDHGHGCRLELTVISAQDLDPGRDSIAYLFLLRLQIQTLQETSHGTLPQDLLPPGRLWSRAVRYLEIFDPVQIRYVGQEFRQLIEFIGQASEAASKVWIRPLCPFFLPHETDFPKPLLATRPVREAMLRLDPSCAVFTSTHLLFVQLCLRARAYTCALPVLDKHVRHFPALSSHASSKSSSALCAGHESSLSFITDSSGLSSKLTYKDYLRYFLYGGMIYMALKEWRKAFHFLSVVISVPTVGSISMVMVEAYKKWVLVGLLANGKVS